MPYALLIALPAGPPAPRSAPAFDGAAAQRFADLALSCVGREYPNKIAHTLESDEDAKPPRLLTPVFFGCYDWHSSVHGHWLLARLARRFPGGPFAGPARAAASRLAEWLPKLAYPIREGEHAQTAFAFGLVLEWARVAREAPMERLVTAKTRELAASLPQGDSRLSVILSAAAAHRESGLAAVTGVHYEGGHWLGTFAVYLVTGAGLPGFEGVVP